MTLKISESQFMKVSYSAMVFIVTAIVGAATWMTTTQLTLNDNSESIQQMRVENEQLRDIVIRIDKNVAEINATIKR